MFKVSLEKIKSLLPIEGADKILKLELEGLDYSLVVGKDNNYQVGDEVIYFPVDSILPDELMVRTGWVGMLSGAAKNRVKTKKLRGVYSQGITIKPSQLGVSGREVNLTELLGVIKWEAELKNSEGAILRPKPEHVYTYDIDGAQNVKRKVEAFADKLVVVTEKLEGTHASFTIDTQNEFHVCSRRMKVEEIEGEQNLYTRSAVKFDIENKLRKYISNNMKDCVATYTLRGELIGPGIQGNYYGLKEIELYLFEFEKNGKPMCASRFFNPGNELWVELGLKAVPVLAYSQKYSDYFTSPIKEMADGMSVINPNKLREGLVVKLANEDEDIGIHDGARNFFKFRGLKYLEKNDY